MRCMFCNHQESKVVDSRPTEDGWAIRRRRECISCSKRFTTYEKVENPMILVIKSDGQRQSFDPEKVRDGLVKACEKRPVTAADIERVVNNVERMVCNSLDQEITSHQIGELVMDNLRDLDQVAYVRFASVYRHFRDINSFKEELNKLLEE